MGSLDGPRMLAVAALSVLITWLIARPLFESTWQDVPGSGVFWIAGIALATTVWWAILDAQAAASAGGAFSTGLLIVLGLSSATLSMTGSMVLGQFAGALAAALAAVAAFSWFARGVSLARGGMLVVAVLFVPLVASSLEQFYSAMPLIYAALLLASPLCGAIADVPGVRPRRPTIRAVVRIVAMSLPAAVAMILAAVVFSGKMAESGELGWQ